MPNKNEQLSEDQRLEKLQEQWEKDWGPEISPWKRRLSAVFIVLAFVALMGVVMLTVSSR